MKTARFYLLPFFLAGFLACDKPPPRTTPRATPWLLTEETRIIDELGRTRVLRGVNARIKGLFDVSFDDGRTALEPIPDFDGDDVAQILDAGINFLRLPINWSGLQPVEGAFSQKYLDRLDEIVALCADRGLYVMIDFHQDAWSKEIGENGAPLWAIEPPPTQLREGPLVDLEQRRNSGQVIQASLSFFQNKKNLQERFIPVWQLITGRFASNSAVIGYEPMNEPVSWQLDPDEALLHVFYNLVAGAMREVNDRQILWLEPDVLRNVSLSAPILSAPFRALYVVYSPHLYPWLGGMKATGYSDWKTQLQDTFSSLVAETRSWGAPAVWGAWGIHPDDPEASGYIRAVRELSAKKLVGDAVWLWKEESHGTWGYFTPLSDGTWQRRENAFVMLGTPYPMATPGVLEAWDWNPDTRVLTVNFTTASGAAAPLLWAGYGNSQTNVTVQLDGKPLTIADTDNRGRIMPQWEGQSGTFELTMKVE